MSDNKKPDQIRENRVTYDDYAAMPDDGPRYEIADGELELMSPSPSLRHQSISSQLQFALMQSCQTDYVIFNAPFDLILSETEVRQPDLAMVHRSRLSILTRRGIEGPPDLVVEILSPSSVKRDKVHKVKSYARYSIPEYWIVDASNRTLEQYMLRQAAYELADVYSGDEQVRSPRLPCIDFSINELLSRVPDLPE